MYFEARHRHRLHRVHSSESLPKDSAHQHLPPSLPEVTVRATAPLSALQRQTPATADIGIAVDMVDDFRFPLALCLFTLHKATPMGHHILARCLPPKPLPSQMPVVRLVVQLTPLMLCPVARQQKPILEGEPGTLPLILIPTFHVQVSLPISPDRQPVVLSIIKHLMHLNDLMARQ